MNELRHYASPLLLLPSSIQPWGSWQRKSGNSANMSKTTKHKFISLWWTHHVLKFLSDFPLNSTLLISFPFSFQAFWDVLTEWLSVRNKHGGDLTFLNGKFSPQRISHRQSMRQNIWIIHLDITQKPSSKGGFPATLQDKNQHMQPPLLQTSTYKWKIN